MALVAAACGGGLWGCEGPPLILAAAGDLQLGPGTRAAQLRALAPLFAGDLRFANLEGPLTSRGAQAGAAADGEILPGADALRFAAPPALAAGLFGRLDVVSLANNHALDQGEAGRADTARALLEQGIQPAWEAHEARLARGGRLVQVLAWDLSGGAGGSGLIERAQAELPAAVSRARREGAVVVSLHWGRTGSLLPEPAQRRLAALLVDAGAAVVLGHGPHSLQGIERRGAGVIAYSLGNLAFQCRCTAEEDAYVLRVGLDDAGRAGPVWVVPIRAGLRGAAPRTSTDPGLRELIEGLSQDLGTTGLRFL